MNIKYTSVFADHTGYGEAARQTITALNSVGVGLTTEIVSFVPDKLKSGLGVDLALANNKRKIDYDIKILELTPEWGASYLEPSKYNILYCFWEVMGVKPEWVELCNKFNRVWTTSNIYAQTFKDCGVTVPIDVIPQPINITLEPKHYQKLHIQGHNGVLFYSIFQWTERKNPEMLIKTYLETFSGRGNVTLLLKTYRDDFSESERKFIYMKIEEWKRELNLRHYPRIVLFLNNMSGDEIKQLHATGDIYVSAHRGEGWGLPQMEAMLFGNPIISTNFGGIHEHLNDTNAYLLPYDLTPVFGMGHIFWYDDTMKWASVNKGSLAMAMQRAFFNREEAKNKGKLAENLIKQKFNYQAVGNYIKNLLEGYI